MPSCSNSTDPVMRMWSSSRHSMSIGPPGQRHRHVAAGQLFAAHGAHGRGAGGAAAGLGEAGAPLPSPQGNGRGARDLCQRDVGALRKQRMVLQHRPDAAEVIGRRRRRPRRSHADCRRWRRKANAGSACRWARSAARWRACRETPRPAECRASRSSAAHIDRDAIMAATIDVEHAGLGLELQEPCGRFAPPRASRCSACRCRRPRPPSRRCYKCAHRLPCPRTWGSCSTIIWSKCDSGCLAIACATDGLDRKPCRRANRRSGSRCRDRSSCGMGARMTCVLIWGEGWQDNKGGERPAPRPRDQGRCAPQRDCLTRPIAGRCGKCGSGGVQPCTPSCRCSFGAGAHRGIGGGARSPRRPRAAEPGRPSRSKPSLRGWCIRGGWPFLPDRRLLVTERPGRLRILGKEGELSSPCKGVPKVYASGQGGLLDVPWRPILSARTSIYLSFAEPRGGGKNGTSVAQGQASRGTGRGGRLEDVQVIFRQEPAYASSHHFGSRIVFMPDGSLFVTLGERFSATRRGAEPGQPPRQARARCCRTASAYAGNPKLPGWQPEVWSIGHRNVQGGSAQSRERAAVDHRAWRPRRR